MCPAGGVVRLSNRLARCETLKRIPNDEVYALTAYLLAINKVIAEDATLDAASLAKVPMPNRDGFVLRFPDRI